MPQLLNIRSGIHPGVPGDPTPCRPFRCCSGKESACQCGKHKRHRFDPWVGKIPWGSKWQPTPVFFPGKSQGQRRLAGYSPWGHKGSDTTEDAHTHTSGSSLSYSIYFLSIFSLNFTSSLWIISEDFSCLACLTFSILVSKFTCSLQTAFELCSEFPFLVHVLEFERHRGCIGIWLKISYYIV